MMVKVLAMSGLSISPNEWAAWRPTKTVRGDVRGIAYGVQCFATDGNLAIFQTGQGHWFVGHTRDFHYTDTKGNSQKGCPPSLFAKEPTGFSGPRKKKAAKTEKEKLRERVAKLESLLGL
jgi:hypothetical protein